MANMGVLAATASGALTATFRLGACARTTSAGPRVNLDGHTAPT